MEGEPEWVGGFFDRLSIIETNINNRFYYFDSRFDHFERRMDHVEYDVHQLQPFHNISCSWPPPMPPLLGNVNQNTTENKILKTLFPNRIHVNRLIDYISVCVSYQKT